VASFRYWLLNVFAVPGQAFSGNPLCVFEDARGLDPAQMQALAAQFNLSETTFVLPPSGNASARVRIFTPTFEMPFAGHPSLGTAHVVRALRSGQDAVALEMAAGEVEVQGRGSHWTLKAPRPPQTRVPDATPEQLAQAVGLASGDLAGPALWVDTGVEQLVLPLATPADVERAAVNPSLLKAYASTPHREEGAAYVWALQPSGDVLARYLFLTRGVVTEDPATGSACANLAGWMLATGGVPPIRLKVRQGAQIQRPSALDLRVGADRAIHVGGEVLELGRGSISL